MGYYGHHSNTGKIIGAGIFGLLLGAAAGMLLSPKSGKQNREDIKNWMRRMSEELNDRLRDTKEMTRERYDQLVDVLTDKYRRMQDIKENELDDFSDELKRRWERIKRRWQEQ